MRTCCSYHKESEIPKDHSCPCCEKKVAGVCEHERRLLDVIFGKVPEKKSKLTPRKK